MSLSLQNNLDEYLPLRDVVFKTLRQAILTGELAPGERLMEVHLADRLGVSRTPIREAIRKLELEGLVIMVPRKGAMVAQISKENLKDVLEVRAALEKLAVELACERITQEGIIDLKIACEYFAQMTRTGDVTRISKADEALHNVIVKATGNQRLEQMISNLSEQMYRYRFEYLKESKYHTPLIEEHRVLYEAIKERNKEKASAQIVTHIENQLNRIMEHLHFTVE